MKLYPRELSRREGLRETVGRTERRRGRPCRLAQPWLLSMVVLRLEPQGTARTGDQDARRFEAPFPEGSGTMQDESQGR